MGIVYAAPYRPPAPPANPWRGIGLSWTGWDGSEWELPTRPQVCSCGRGCAGCSCRLLSGSPARRPRWPAHGIWARPPRTGMRSGRSTCTRIRALPSSWSGTVLSGAVSTRISRAHGRRNCRTVIAGRSGCG